MSTLITGASSGIGLEFAKIFASKGNDLILVARRKKNLLNLKKEIETEFKVSVKVFDLDLSIPNSPEILFASLQKKKLKVETLINNAGFGYFGEFLEKNLKIDEEMINLNILALTKLTKLFAIEMSKLGGGKILNIGSTAGFQPGPLMATYFATKAYVNTFSEALAEEFRNSSITISVLCPGATESEFRIVAGTSSSRIFKNRKVPTSKAVAEFGYKILQKSKPIAIHGLMNKILIFSTRFTPRFMLTKVTKFLIKSR